MYFEGLSVEKGLTDQRSSEGEGRGVRVGAHMHLEGGSPRMSHHSDEGVLGNPGKVGRNKDTTEIGNSKEGE